MHRIPDRHLRRRHLPDKVATIRAARSKYLGDGPYPSSTMVGVTGLVHPDLLIEIEAIAALD